MTKLDKFFKDYAENFDLLTGGMIYVLWQIFNDKYPETKE